MPRLSFASLAFVLFLASNFGVSDSDFNALFLEKVVEVSVKLGGLDSKIQVK